MRYTFVALLLAVSTFAVSHKGGMAHVRRSGDPTNQPPTDVEILNYALTLEYLERDFYKQALAKFSKHDFHHAGYPRYVRREFVKIGRQEKEHVAFLAGALGSLGVGECQYDFSAALETVDSFLATSRILEGVGTSAYLGEWLEARVHRLTDQVPRPTSAPRRTSPLPARSSPSKRVTLPSSTSSPASPPSYVHLLHRTLELIKIQPTPYDAPLNYAEVYSLAAPFIIPGTCGSSGTLRTSLIPLLGIICEMSRSNLFSQLLASRPSPSSRSRRPTPVPVD